MCMETKLRWAAARVTTWSKRTSSRPCASFSCCTKRSSVCWILSAVSGSTALSIRPWLELRIRCQPSFRMLRATAMATTGSSQSQPVTCTSATPATTPMEVQTSVRKWRPSASSAIELCTLAALSSTQAPTPLSTVLARENAMPQPSCSSGCGFIRRSTEVQRMPSAAPKISMPSKPDEKYSALWWPCGWSSSAGRSAIVTIIRANTAPARLTKDSMASDSRPTEPVTYQARVLRMMVRTAAAADIQSRVLGRGSFMDIP